MPPSATHRAPRRRLVAAASLCLAIAALTLGQTQPAPPPASAPADDIHILTPTVDKANNRLTIPGAFWKEDVCDWCETALSGRPSDFLHETFVCTTTTRTILEKAFRDAGFHDADAWVSGVRDFPKIRGDRFMILLEFTQDGKPQRYSLDELITFLGWGVSAGPYGFMFKGDPGHAAAAPAPAPPAAAGTEEIAPRTQILRDDPQIALTFKGLQSISQSFADHPFCYDDWIYPMMDIGRNYAALGANVLHSNGAVPVTLIFQKCTEEEFLTESIKVWHDPAWIDQMKQRIEIARDIDKNKAALWALEPQLHKLPPNTQDEQARMLMAHIELGYATLDAAWGKYSATHAHFATDQPDALAVLQNEATRWSDHLLLKQKSAAARSRAADAQYASFLLTQKPGPRTPEEEQQLQKYRGQQIEQLAIALAADTDQERAYWQQEKSRLDPADPRSAWIAAVSAHVDLIAARDESSTAGVAYGKALQAAPSPPNLKSLESQYARTLTLITLAQTRIDLAETQFEITKREGFDNDPDLPALRQKQKQLEAQIQQLQLSTMPKP